MGLGDAINSLGDGLEGAVDSAKEGVGEAVNWGTDRAADGLSAVGADGAAEGVRDFGEGVNNRLGGDVAERQLGESDDPKELLHGSPAALEARAKHLRDFHKAFDNVGRGMRSLDVGTWQGKAADAFREKFDMQPKAWLKAADACEDAARALDAYADTVRWAQSQAQTAIDLYRQAQRTSQQAADAHNARVDSYNRAAQQYNTAAAAGRDPGAKPVEPGRFVDPGAAGLEEAEELLGEARRQRADAARDARTKVQGALDMAPPKPDFTDRLGANLADGFVGTQLNTAHVVGGLFKGGADMLKMARTLNPTDPYNLTHPGEWMKNSSMMLAGLVGTAAHPERLPKAMLGSGWGNDPGDAFGYLLSNVVGGKGAGGFAKGAARGAARDAVTGAAREGVRTSMRDSARQLWCKTFGGDPIDMATGRMALPQTDVSLPAKFPLVFARHFESSYRAGRWFGPTWTSTVDQRLEIDAEGVVLVREDGSMVAYPHPAPGVPVLPLDGAPHPLTVDVYGDYTVTEPDSGRVWEFASPLGDGNGIALLELISDRSGQWIGFEYDEQGAPTAITHSAGYRLKVTTEGERLTGLHLVDAGGDVELVRFGYDERGHLASVTNSSGLPTRFTNDELGRVTSWTDTNDSSYSYAYDDRDRCTHQSGQAGHLRNSYTYDGTDPGTGHAVTTRTDSLGHSTRYLINDRLQVAAEIAPDGATTRTTYDAADRPLTVTDPLGRTTGYAYDQVGRPVMVIRPDGRYSSVGYNHQGLPVVMAQPDGTRVRQEFDAFGNRTAVTDPTGATTRFAYDSAGHLASVTNALGETTGVRCDAAGLPLEITDPLGAVTRYERDAFGRTVTITDPLGATTHLEWTVEGKLARRTAPDGSTETWTYDGEGNCTSHTDALGAVSRYEYTHFDLLAARTGPDGVRYTFEHDTELRLRRVLNPQGLSWSYDYDPAGRLVAETDFDDRRVTYEHDSAGQLAARTTAAGDVIRLERDVLGRTVRKDAAGAVTTFTYDEATGAMTRATGPDAVLTLQRDTAGRLISETVNDRTLTYTHDALGRRTGRTTPTGATSTWTYDAAGNRTGLTTSGRTIAFAHDPAGRELARHIGDTFTATSAFDALGRLTKQELVGPANQRLQHRAYTYRADGNLTGIDDHLNGTRTFDLDTAGRVTVVQAAGWTETYAYDEAGNQTHATWPATMPGQEAIGERTYTGTRIRTAGGVRYEHDAAGRTTLRQKTRLSRKPDTWRYSWDAEDRLTSVITPDGATWRYCYDPLGRRIAKQCLAPDSETILDQVDFTWDGTTLAEQTTHTPGTGGPAITLTWDHDGLRPLTQTERRATSGVANTPQNEIDSRFYAIVTDLVGTPTELVDETGQIAWRTRTTLWGTTTQTSDATTSTPLRFPGQYFDPETELHYNVHRHYDPETARYLTPDPLGLQPADNPLTYVNNPHIWTDPLGLSPCQEFHTVQSRGDAARLRNGGDPWPTEDTRGQYGEGVYSWGSEEEALRYAERLRSRGADVEVLKFKVTGSDFDGLRKGDIVNMSPSDAEAFVDRHSRLYGNGEPHDYDYIRGHTGMGHEHYFSKHVFHLLKFLN